MRMARLINPAVKCKTMKHFTNARWEAGVPLVGHMPPELDGLSNMHGIRWANVMMWAQAALQVHLPPALHQQALQVRVARQIQVVRRVLQAQAVLLVLAVIVARMFQRGNPIRFIRVASKCNTTGFYIVRNGGRKTKTQRRPRQACGFK